jgi:hypothetical protein
VYDVVSVPSRFENGQPQCKIYCRVGQHCTMSFHHDLGWGKELPQSIGNEAIR